MVMASVRKAGAFSFALLVTSYAALATDLPGDKLFPESISITQDGTVYIGSMTGGVLRGSLKSGQVKSWIKAGAYGSGTIFGVLADQRNKMLWVCTNDYSSAGVMVAGEKSGAHLLDGFDLKTGRGKISLPLPGMAPICNDITVANDGAVYVTDSASPQILRWRPGTSSLEVWTSDPIFESPQGGGLDGIAFGSDGNLYLNNFYSGDLFRVDVDSHGKPAKVTKLTVSRSLSKPDGMRLIGGTEFALAEGGGKVDRVTFHGDRAEVQTLVSNVKEPTGVDRYANSIWYVQGYSTWLFGPDAHGQPPALPFRLSQVPLAK